MLHDDLRAAAGHADRLNHSHPILVHHHIQQLNGLFFLGSIVISFFIRVDCPCAVQLELAVVFQEQLGIVQSPVVCNIP